MANKKKSETVPEVESTQGARTERRGRGASVNHVILVGRLAADPDMRYSPQGMAITSMRLVTNDRDDPEYHDLVAFGRTAEVAASHLTKGRLVYIDGRLHGRTWEARDGSKRRSVETVIENLQILSPKPVSDQPA